MDFAIRMLLDDTYELFFDCFDSLYQAKYGFQNSNVGGKYGKRIFERFYKNLRTLNKQLNLCFTYANSAIKNILPQESKLATVHLTTILILVGLFKPMKPTIPEII